MDLNVGSVGNNVDLLLTKDHYFLQNMKVC